MFDWLFGKPVEPTVTGPPVQPVSTCRHLMTRVTGVNTVACGSCPECGQEVNLSIVFDNWLTELRGLREQNPASH